MRPGTLASVGGFLVRLLWPDRCAACRAEIAEGQVFCEACECTVIPIEQACPACALPEDDLARAGLWSSPRPPSGAGLRCRPCQARPFPFAAARACLLYGGAVAEAIVRFKHGGSLAPGRALGRAMVPLLDWASASAVDAVLPVPLHPARLRARGFNQALELLREGIRHRGRVPIGRRQGCAGPGSRPLPVWTSALVRQRDTPPLGRESPAVRRSRLAGAFAITQSGRVRGRRLLVVDDVMTSGATLAECAHTLYIAGAKEVLVGALARADRSSLTPAGSPLPP